MLPLFEIKALLNVRLLKYKYKYSITQEWRVQLRQKQCEGFFPVLVLVKLIKVSRFFLALAMVFDVLNINFLSNAIFSALTLCTIFDLNLTRCALLHSSKLFVELQTT